MIEIKNNEPLSLYTTFRIGGNAKFFCSVESVEQLQDAVKYARGNNLNIFILGGGSNVLISDNGFDGLVIRMKLNEIKLRDNEISAQAGVPLIKLINTAAQSGLTGLEKLAGIPGTFGGAVRGNAGAFGSMIGDVLKEVVVMDNDGQLKTYASEHCSFGYRSSVFKDQADCIIVSAVVSLEKSNVDIVTKNVKETIAKRMANELGGIKSAGSYFMNPVVENEDLRKKFQQDRGMAPKDEKLPAGWLIDQLSLRGKKMGGAAISEKHANYIVNENNATAEDVIMLESFVKQQVRSKLGIQLQSEVSHVGF